MSLQIYKFSLLFWGGEKMFAVSDSFSQSEGAPQSKPETFNLTFQKMKSIPTENNCNIGVA